MWNMMNDICGINRITPFQGFRLQGDSFRRALPYANDLWAFSPIISENDNFRDYFTLLNTRRIVNSFTRLNIRRKSKAESLTINSVGQRPTDIIINSVGRYPAERIIPGTEALKGRNQHIINH